MKVYVVMSNDFPDSAFSKEEDAEAYCATQRAQRQDPRVSMTPLIYWKVYEFELRDGL